MEIPLNIILNTPTKLKILRLFFSRTGDFRVSGREVGRRVEVSPPAAHAALKDLLKGGVLRVEVIGKQHIYRLNTNNRIVKEILGPSFKKELSLKDDIMKFLIKKAEELKIKQKIKFLILYASRERKKINAASNVDVAVIIKNKQDAKEIKDKFIGDIASQFKECFGFNLDSYIRRKPRLSSLTEIYSVTP